MIDKKTETDIGDIKGFLEFWMKFRSFYNDIMGKGAITQEDEKKFIETKTLIQTKYDTLRKGLEFKYMPHARLTDPVSDILAINTVRFMSEKNLKKLNDDWRDSYIFLNNILERLKNKKRRLDQFNPISVYIKRLFERKGGTR